MKKLVCLALALAMVLGMASFTAASAEGEYPLLTWVTVGSTAPIDNELVLAELNKISEEKVGCDVYVYYMSTEEANLSVQSGEVYDMYFTTNGFMQFNVNVSNGIFANIEGKVQEWTPDLYAIMPESVWNLARTGDALYCIPVKKDYAKEDFIFYDAQFAQDNGFEIPESIYDWDDLTDYLVALQAAMKEDPSLGSYAVPLAGGTGSATDNFDLIDGTAAIGVDFGETTVKSLYEVEKVMENFRVLRKWYEMGLINPDAPTVDSINTEHGIQFCQAWTGYDMTPSKGFWTKSVKFYGPTLQLDGIQGAMNAFSVTLEDDEERFKMAMEYQQLVNTDKTYRDMIAYGIEGTHFDYADVTDHETGEVLGQIAIRTDLGKSNYAPGRYTQGAYDLCSIEGSIGMVDGTFPNPVLNQWELYFAEAEEAPVSAIAGFLFDPSDFTDTYAVISAIKNEYLKDIQSGAVDPDVAVPEMLDRMYAAGLQDVIDEAQRQLDEYLASK